MKEHSTLCLMTLLLALFALSVVTGCIPSEAPPPAAPPTAAKAPPSPSAVAQTVTPTPAAAAVPVAPAPTPPPQNTAPSAPNQAPGGGKNKGSVGTLSIADPNAPPNASIGIQPIADGKGFQIEGTFNLKGTLIPESPGKWRLKASYSVREDDFASGDASASNLLMDNEVPAPSILLTLPVRMPKAKASEDKPLRTIPFELVIDAPDNAKFTVIFIDL